MATTLKQKTAKSSAAAKRTAKNYRTTKKIARSERETDYDLASYNDREASYTIRSSGIFDTYSATCGYDNEWN